MTADDENRDLGDIRSDIERTRAQLAQTLDDIEERLDVGKRFDQWRARTERRWEEFNDANPETVKIVAGSVIAVSVLVGGAVIGRAFRR